jgi:hypothetical protein
MARLGVQFQKPPPAIQASLDRVVFALMRRKSEAKRPLQSEEGRREAPKGGAPAPGAERRLAPRVEVSEGDRLSVALRPDRPLGALSAAKPPPGPSLTLLDISTTGCALSCPDPCTLKTGQLIKLRLKGADLDVELTGKIVFQH